MEGTQEGSWEEYKKKVSHDPNFHPEEKKDPVETLLEREGPDGAFDELMDRLEKDPNDAEARRQALLLINRFADLISRMREKISH